MTGGTVVAGTGDVRLGNGKVLISAGSVAGAVTTTNGSNDWFLSGTASYTGTLAAGGVTNAIAVTGGNFNGTIQANGTGTDSLYLAGGTYSNTSLITNTVGNANYYVTGGTFESGNRLIASSGTPYLYYATNTTTGFTPDVQAGSIIQVDSASGATSGRIDIAAMTGTTAPFGDTFGGTVTMTTANNTLNLFNGASFLNNGTTYTASAALSGTSSNMVNINAGGTSTINGHTITGQISLANAAVGSNNNVRVYSGTLIGYNEIPSIIGSSYTTTNQQFTGGLVANIHSSGAAYAPGTTAGTSNYTIFGGQVFNIRHSDRTTGVTQDLVQAANTQDTIVYVGSSQKNYYGNSILNLKQIDLVQGANLTIGDIDLNDTTNDYVAYDLRSSSLNYIPGRNNFFINDGLTTGTVQGRQAQITADNVNVYANSKLTLHENAKVFGGAQFAATSEERNVINRLEIIGNPGNGVYYDHSNYSYTAADKAVVTVDRTTINGSAAGGAKIVVRMNGILQGFGEIKSADDHTPMRPNIIGDVQVMTGGLFRPFDASIFAFHGSVASPYPNMPATGETQAQYQARVNAWLANPINQTFETNVNKLKGDIWYTKGEHVFDQASHYSTRLWAQHDGTKTMAITSDGRDYGVPNSPPAPVSGVGAPTTVWRYYSDGLLADTFNFQDVMNIENTLNVLGVPADSPTRWSAVQQRKIQYEPVFGRANELRSKLDYQLYTGTPGDDSVTYYFSVAVAQGGVAIPELVNYNDANHLFNRDIVFSDMLGEWDFLKQSDNSGVVLRFRMLAPHPAFGGIQSIMPERNAREAGRLMDEIRYPFMTAYNNEIYGYLGYDPSASPYYVPNNNWSGYNIPGYDGNMNAYYSTQPQFTNYNWDRIADFENYLRAVQLEIQSGDTLYQTVRLLHAEPYASMTNVNFSVMDQFVANRERNGSSALYMVEKDCLDPEDEQTMYIKNNTECTADMYVVNPFRIWVSAFGNTGRMERSGDEYGYKDELYGTSLGIIKEFGDLYLGLTGGYARGKNKWSELNAKATSDNYLAEALIGYRFRSAFIEAFGDYAYMDHTMNRTVEAGRLLNPAYPDLGQEGYYNGIYRARMTGDYHDNMWGGGLRLGYEKVFCQNWLFLPTVGVNYYQTRNAPFTEDGRDDAFSRLVFDKGGAIEKDLWRIPVVLRLSRVIAFEHFQLTPEARVGYIASLGDMNGTATYTWIGHPIPDRYAIAYGADPGRHMFTAGGTLEISRRGRFYLAGNYDFAMTENTNYHQFSVQSGINF